METRSKKKLRGPLPGGDRRGTPGADAGCYSMRTVSGEELSRRAPTGSSESTTAEQNDEIDRLTDRTISPVEPFSPSTISYTPSTATSPSTHSNIDDQDNIRAMTLAEDVSQEALATQSATTKAGKPRVRMQWSKEINTFIMRTYFYVTKLETDRTMYCKKLHEQFSIKFPHLKVSAQRVADQRRVIVRNKLLPADIINTLKREIADQLSREEIENTLPQTSSTSTPITQLLENISSSITPYTQISSVTTTTTQQTLLTQSQASTQTTTLPDTGSINQALEDILVSQVPQKGISIQELINQLQTALILYTGTDPTTRPKLPKLKENKNLYGYVDIFNKQILGNFISAASDLNTIHTLIYCSALVICQNLGYNIVGQNSNSRPKTHKPQKPPWQIRIETDIKNLRADIGRLTQYINNNRSRKVIAAVEVIFRKTKIHTVHERNNVRPEEYLDTLKQKLTLKSQRLSRYLKALKRKVDNKVFTINEKQFYRSLNSHNTQHFANYEMPQPNELRNYWSDLWKKQRDHKDSAKWITEEEYKMVNTQEMELNDITLEDIAMVTRKMKNWKAAGIDNVHNFWYKKFFTLHYNLAININEIIKGEQELPKFVTKGITYMLPKSNDTSNPSQYRPITCLPTIYKLITSIVTSKITKHLERYNIFSEEQKGCRQNHKGCKEQLVIDSTILKHTNKHKRNLHISYIDYKKAFDSVPHSWLIRVLHIYKINPILINFLKNAMSNWRTTLHLSNGTDPIISEEIPIENGIFQGDSLSPLWFCLALNPLSTLLNNSNSKGYKLDTNTSITHLMYMDDIKLFARTSKCLDNLLSITTQFS